MLRQFILLCLVSCIVVAQQSGPALVTVSSTKVSIDDWVDSRSKTTDEIPMKNVTEPLNPGSSVSAHLELTSIAKEPQFVSTKLSQLTTKSPITTKPTQPSTSENTPTSPTTTTPPPTAVVTSSHKVVTSPETSPSSTEAPATSSGGSTVTRGPTASTTSGSCKVSISDLKLLALLIFSVVLFTLL